MLGFAVNHSSKDVTNTTAYQMTVKQIRWVFGYNQGIILLISPPKHMLWELVGTH